MRTFTRHLSTNPMAKFLMAALVAATTLIGRAAPIPPAEQLLPADTLLVACVPDMSKSRDTFKKSPMGQLLNDPSMKPFCDKFTAKFHGEFLDPLKRDLGINPDDFTAMAQGLMVVAVVQNGWSGQDNAVPGALFLMDARDKSSQLKKTLATLRKNWIDAGKTVRTEKVRDTDFSVVMMSSNDVPKALKDFLPQHQDTQELGKDTPDKPEVKSEIYVGQYQSLLIASDSAKTVDKVMARLTGGSLPALADDPAFDADKMAVLRDAQFYTWLNAKRVFDVVSTIQPDAPNPEAPSLTPRFDMAKLMPALGFSGLKTVVLSSQSSGEGSFFNIYIGAPESTRQGLFQLLAAETKDSNPPAFVPADVIKFQRWRFDGQKSIATMEKMLGDISPQALIMWNYVLGMAGETESDKAPTFDVRKDVFGNLGDDLITYSKSPQDPDSTTARSIFFIGSPNPDKLADALKTGIGLYAHTTEVKQHEFLGRKVYSIDLSSRVQRAGTNSTPRSSLSYAASGGYVAISTDTALLEEYLRSNDGQGKSLRELPGLADAAEKVGGQNTGQFSYQNQVDEMRIAFKALKAVANMDLSPSGMNPLAGSMPFASPAKSIKEWLDFSLLPDFNQVSKYFSFSVSAGSVTTDGLAYKMFSPNPPGLK